MSAIAAILAAMLSFVPLRAHSSFEPRAVTEARYLSIAGDIAQAAEESPAPGLGAAETGVLLASVASYESNFAARVDDCRVRGGTRAAPSWGLWQVAGTRAALCTSRLAAARTALGIIATSLATCRREPLSLYVAGRCLSESPKAHWRWQRASAWWGAHPFDPGAKS
jgi:hypothetical protein